MKNPLSLIFGAAADDADPYEHSFTLGEPSHFHWQIVAYDGKDPTPNGMAYTGAVSLDVLGDTYAEAMATAERIRPRTSEKSGYEVRSVVEHLPGPCH